MGKILRFLKLASLAASLTVLTSCGGGGGGGGGSTQQTAIATLQTGTVAVGSTEVGTTVTVSSDTAGQSILTVENASNKLTNAQVGQVMVFEASSAMPLGFAGKVQSVQTTDVNSTPTTTATFVPANITDVFQNLNLNLSNVATNPQLIAGVALQNGARAYTKTAPQVAGGILGKIQNGLIELNLTAQNTDTAVGVDFSGGIKATFWRVKDQNGQWVWTGKDPGTPAPKVVIVFTGQVELQNPNFSQANIVIEDGKLVTHNLQLKGTLKRNIKASVTGNFEASAADLGELFSKQPTGRFYTKNGTYNEISFDFKGVDIKIHGVEKDPSKIIIGAAVISAAGVVPTYGNSQTGNVLKTIPVGMVVTFFMTADMKVEASLSLGYQWRDMDINAGMGFSYDDSLGLPVSLLTGQYQIPVPFWDATTHLDQTEGASFDVSGSAVATLTAGVDGGIVLVGLEISQATVEGGIRGSLAGQLSMPVGGIVSGCYSSASVTAGVRALLDVAAGAALKTDFKSKWLKWLNTSVATGYVYEFPMYPAEGVDYLAETTIWSVGDDTCHNPQFSATGTVLYSYSFDANATTYQPMVSSYTWDFGDGATTTGVTATHTYGSPGSYTAKLTVLYSDGVQKTASKTITVAEVPALNPAFTVNFNGLQASFDASTSTPGTDITSYSWSFGDGATATGITASHTYAAYSSTPWSVTLTVTDSYGRTASISQNVVVTNKIIFLSKRDGNWEIYSVDPEGSNPTNLTNNSADDILPAVSPDRTKIAFVSERDGNNEIYVMGIGGTTPTRLTDNSSDDLFPTWSPDGEQIAFVSKQDGNYEIYTMNWAGSNQKRLTYDSYDDGQPDWSPDGSKIVFVSNRDGNNEVYIMNASDGSNQINLTQDYYADDTIPFFSPIGSRIAFISNRDGDYDLWIMETNGTNPYKLTTDAYDKVGWYAWSPDGTRIAFDSTLDGDYEIYVINSDGTNLRQLTNNTAKDRFSSWTWDSTKIVFISDRDGNDEVYLMDPDGANPVNLSKDPSNEDLPMASPVYEEGGGCFIATAAFGSYLDSHVLVLREFRDNYLLSNGPGRAFVTFYYKYSPPIAHLISRHENVRTVTRWGLTPVVFGIKYPCIPIALTLIVTGFLIHRKVYRKT